MTKGMTIVKKDKVKIGFAPTRRNLFSAETAMEYADLTRNKLDQLDIDYIDIKDINDDGLLYDDEGVERIYKKFRDEGIDGLFVANENFGNEWAVARLAKKLNVPVLLWGPRDEHPAEDGSRLRDSQCGLFAIGKVLRRFQVPFTYIPNCELEDETFSRGVKVFEKVCNVIKVFKNTRILQIGTRPFDFWSTMTNEGELLERFNIQLSPIPLQELTKEIDRVLVEEKSKLAEGIENLRNIAIVEIADDKVEMVIALKIAIRNLTEKYGCNSGVIQCWTALQDEIGILPYATESLLQDEGLPVTCETDIHGVISELLIEAATLGEHRAMFADVNNRHPHNDNGELLQHLGVFPFSTAKDKPVLPESHFVFDYPGSVAFEAKPGTLTLCRFDGDNGEYSLLMGNAEVIDGPYTQGTYSWVEFDNLARLETKLVYGPYIHHVAAVHAEVVPVLYEACKYLGITPDFYDPIEEKVQGYLRGE